jgi:hypothetical protein
VFERERERERKKERERERERERESQHTRLYIRHRAKLPAKKFVRDGKYTLCYSPFFISPV